MILNIDYERSINNIQMIIIELTKHMKSFRRAYIYAFVNKYFGLKYI